MVTKLAYVFGVVFLVLGLLGYVSAVTPEGYLLGVFAVNGMHNFVHVVFGVLGLAAGYVDGSWPKTYFKVTGVVYVLVALLGFYVGNGMLLGMMANNMADAWLHLVLGAVALYVGFGFGCKCIGDVK